MKKNRVKALLAMTAMLAMVGSFSVLATGCAGMHDSGEATYHMVPKAEHDIKYPHGHSGSEHLRCVYSDSENAYFCPF